MGDRVTTADRPGVLAVIGDSFNKFEIEIISARITTRRKS